MDFKKIIQKVKPEMKKALDHLDEELSKIRVGRASPSLVEDIEVDCFGQKMPLKQLAAISTPEPKQILIQPWEKSYVEPIEKAIRNSEINLNPIVDQEIIRIKVPSLTEESRENLLQILSRKKEESRKTIRHWREEAWKEIQDKEQKGDISEDDKFRAKDKLQDLVDEYNEKIEKKVESKKKNLE